MERGRRAGGAESAKYTLILSGCNRDVRCDVQFWGMGRNFGGGVRWLRRAVRFDVQFRGLERFSVGGGGDSTINPSFHGIVEL